MRDSCEHIPFDMFLDQNNSEADTEVERNLYFWLSGFC